MYTTLIKNKGMKIWSFVPNVFSYNLSKFSSMLLRWVPNAFLFSMKHTCNICFATFIMQTAYVNDN